MLRHVWLWALVVLCVLARWIGVAYAHESAPGVLALKQVSAHQFLARWTAPFPPIEGLSVRFPEPCTLNGSPTFEEVNAPRVPTLLDCDGKPLAGSLEISSAQATIGPIAVNVDWMDGTQSMYLSRGNPPTVALGGTAGTDGPWQVIRDYVELGLEHILLGIDHLLFLLGLLLVVNGWKSLLGTISAFTLAHSITLAAASLDVVRVPTAPVEICIALSVLLLAVEVARKQQSLTRRKPWLVAFGFGLLHGLGFASALADVGLPRHAVALSLFAFNVGVELGQLVVVGFVFAGLFALRRVERAKERFEWLAVGVLTVCSVFWLLQRVESWLRDLGVV